MIIAIDFDGTIVEHRFPAIGPLRLNAKEVINTLYYEGHSILIWTCRTSQNQFPDAEPTVFHVKEFLDREGIYFTTINHNDPANPFQPSPKIYADVYIDDKNLGGILDDWEDIYKLLREHPNY